MEFKHSQWFSKYFIRMSGKHICQFSVSHFSKSF